MFSDFSEFKIFIKGDNMIVALDNGVADSSAFVGKKVFDNLKAYDTLVLANKSLSNAISFYLGAKAKGIRPIIGVIAVCEGIEYLFIAHCNAGYSALCGFESRGYNTSIFDNAGITAICLDIIDAKAEIKSKYSFLRNEVTTSDKYKNIILKANTEVLPFKVANMADKKDFFTLAYCKAIDEKGFYEDMISHGKVYGHTLQSKEIFDNCETWQNILSKCVDDYKFGNPIPPNFRFVKEECEKLSLSNPEYAEILNKNPDDDTLLSCLCDLGLKDRFKGKNVPKEYSDRLEYELKVIKQMKFSGYFLIVWDFINYAKTNDIPVGPGRGSAAGSLAVYSLKITNIDPIPYSLLFERFLNPDRVSFPDIDIDFCQDKREQVIEYVSQRYGKENVSQVITFGTLSAKAAIKDAARLLGMPIPLGDKLSKMIPETPGIKFKDVFETSKDAFEALYQEDEDAKRVMEVAQVLEGHKRTSGVHASGLVISNDPIPTRAPLYNINGAQVVGYEGTMLEAVDLVKFDFLGLKTLTLCDNAIKDVFTQTGQKIDLFNIPLDDRKVFDYISTGNTVGMFQIESLGMQDLAKRLKPHTFEDLIAMIALYRPGPMQAGLLDSFVDRKNGKEEISYFFTDMEDALKPILLPTYGVIVYQEQVIQIVQVIAGFSLGEADLVRRAMGKKKPEEMAKISKDFVAGAVKKGYAAEEAEKLFELIEKFAGYGFNKSHSAAYAMVSYYTAWLKFYYPEFFMAHLINSDIDKTDSLVNYVQECKRMGIEVLKPTYRSKPMFRAIGKGKIDFGLKAIKGVGVGGDILSETIDMLFTNEPFDLLKLLSITQKDSQKEFDVAVKRKDKLLVKRDKLVISINEAQNKIEGFQSKDAILTAREQKSFDKYSEQLSQKTNELESINVELSDVEIEIEQIRRLMGIENKKLNKTSLESLINVGVFDETGLTRKTLFEHLGDLLIPSKHSQIVFGKEEYSLPEIINKEVELTGLILSRVFSDDLLREIEGLEITDETPIGVLISNESKVTKSGKKFLEACIYLPSGEIIKASDFNLVSEKCVVGQIYAFSIKINGNYRNLVKVFDLQSKLGDYQRKRTSQNVTLFDDFDNINFTADQIIVSDFDGRVVAVLNR